jgi:hypothetical protein
MELASRQVEAFYHKQQASIFGWLKESAINLDVVGFEVDYLVRRRLRPIYLVEVVRVKH